jgi:leucyl aminopeptidase
VTITFIAGREVGADTTVLGVPVAKGPVAVGASGIDVDAAFLTAGGFEGKVGQTLPLLADDGTTVIAVGVGDLSKVTLESLRRSGAALAKAAWRSPRLATTLLDAAPADIDRKAAAQAIAEGMALATYRFTTYKSESKPCLIEQVTVAGTGGRALQTGLDRGARVAEAVAFARDLVNEPAGALTPTRLAEIAVEVAEREGLQVTVLDEVAIANEGLGALAGVARGSAEPARLIELVYEPTGKPRATVAIVGKGITFDSGGLSLKTGDGMMTMKTDMGGAAAVLATMSALAAVGSKVKVIGIMPTTENMPGGRATKPGDVLKARNGKTIEVLNTDAEGRLVLADGLSLAVEQNVDAIIDLATLTGAQVVALGKKIAAVLGTSEALMDQVQEAGDRAGEPIWPLPLPDDYRSHIDSEIADMKNIGNPGQAGTIIGGLFLKEFVGDVPWAHIDIAGPSRADADEGYFTKGATGFGVRTLLELLTTFKKV